MINLQLNKIYKGDYKMSKLIFLSHIHEEKDLALLIKNVLEEEFSGFVEVFVSSDGVSIPAGSNFLKRIEDGLIHCNAGLYLISPSSVKRNWINFELGALWIRNKVNILNNAEEIPAIPLCHSGMLLSDLPQPINNLNGVQANISSQLEFAFKSIQSAVGGKGRLKTDFDLLSSHIIEFEREYTLGDNLKKVFKIINGDIIKIYNFIDTNPYLNNLTLNLGMIETRKIEELKSLEKNELRGHISISIKNSGIAFGDHGAINGADVDLSLEVKLLKEFKDTLLKM